jgi:hypothetical protein
MSQIPLPRLTIGTIPPAPEMKSLSDDPAAVAEVAHYIAQLTAEMAGMARSAKLDLLGYFLEMARIEATSSLTRIEG